MKFNIPRSMQAEHEEQHTDLEKAMASGGETGAAAKVVADVLHAHFESEEKYALPPLGLLPALANGILSPEMTQAWEMTDTLKAELPRMLEEHKEIVDAVRAVYRGERYLSQRIADLLMDVSFRNREPSMEISPSEQLSLREREILQLVAEGQTSQEIAEILSISPKTVDTYRSRLMRKIGVDDVVGLVKFAIQHGVISLE